MSIRYRDSKNENDDQISLGKEERKEVINKLKIKEDIISGL